MSTKHLKPIVFISICVLGFLIFGFFGTRGLQTVGSTQTKTETRTETIRLASPRVFRKPLSPSQESLTDLQNTDFYRTIIDNNLFRPLGWRPQRPKEPYRLLGTILPKDTNAQPKAILQTTAGNKLYTLSVGEKLDADTTLTHIQPKQITLATKGKHRTLRLSSVAWLR